MAFFGVVSGFMHGEKLQPELELCTVKKPSTGIVCR
jgi:hypothetical protein